MAHPVSPLAPARWPILPGITGVEIATLRVGFYKHARNDLLCVRMPEGTSVAGAFTTSTTRSADVDWCRGVLAESGGKARALVVNAGNSNAFTGEAGLAKNRATVAEVVRLAGVQPAEVLLSATGVIGVPVKPNVLAERLPEAWQALRPAADNASWRSAAEAIMTTDTFPKVAGARVKLPSGTAGIAGIAKGSGMIAPNMATMLVYIFSDAAVAPEALQTMVSRAIGPTFNSITVDGDTSTSDTLLVFATGQSGANLITDASSREGRIFARSLAKVMRDLAHLVVRDGEGASKFITVNVTGAASAKAAKAVASSIANSPLVKTALAASDANWGRVVMAVGKSGQKVDRDKISVSFGSLPVAVNGQVARDYDEAKVTAHLKGDMVTLDVDLGVGRGKSVVWTCDLTHGYVSINGAYRT